MTNILNDVCRQCGQTPCNCTHINEQKEIGTHLGGGLGSDEHLNQNKRETKKITIVRGVFATHKLDGHHDLDSVAKELNMHPDYIKSIEHHEIEKPQVEPKHRYYGSGQAWDRPFVSAAGTKSVWDSVNYKGLGSTLTERVKYIISKKIREDAE